MIVHAYLMKAILIMIIEWINKRDGGKEREPAIMPRCGRKIAANGYVTHTRAPRTMQMFSINLMSKSRRRPGRDVHINRRNVRTASVAHHENENRRIHYGNR